MNNLRASDNASLWGTVQTSLSHSRCYSAVSYTEQIHWISCQLSDASMTFLHCNWQPELLHFLNSWTKHHFQVLLKTNSRCLTEINHHIFLLVSPKPQSIMRTFNIENSITIEAWTWQHVNWHLSGKRQQLVADARQDPTSEIQVHYR